MRTANAITKILFPLLIGLLIGAAFAGDSGLAVWCIIMIIADIFVGCFLQYKIEEEEKEVMKGFLLLHLLKLFANSNEEHQLIGASRENNYEEDYEEDYEDEYYEDDYDEMIDKFKEVHAKLKENGARIIEDIRRDEAGEFLLELCSEMEHAPVPSTLERLRTVFVRNIGDNPAIIYSFRYIPSLMCQNVVIFLVLTEDFEIRFFAVETSISALVLCEYSEGKHLNYGPVELKSVPTRIKELLNSI